MENRIAEQREKQGLSQRELAKKAGTSGQMIGMLERGERKLTVDWLRRLSSAIGCNPIDLVPSVLLPDPPTGWADVSGLTVRGAVQAGVWRESLEWDAGDWYSVPMPSEDPRYPGIPLFGLEVRGSSMNKVFPHGTILACIHLIHYPVHVDPGRYVIAEQVNDRGEFESTVKQIRKDADGTTWLWPCSDDPMFQAPLKVNGGDTCRVTALVVRSSRPE